jgi:hypothetical protein
MLRGAAIRKYDAADYCAELSEMAIDGVATRDFIARSNPSASWFNAKVLPICTFALCHGCGRHFNPQLSGTLRECTWKRCPVALDSRNR